MPDVDVYGELLPRTLRRGGRKLPLNCALRRRSPSHKLLFSSSSSSLCTESEETVAVAAAHTPQLARTLAVRDTAPPACVRPLKGTPLAFVGRRNARARDVPQGPQLTSTATYQLVVERESCLSLFPESMAGLCWLHGGAARHRPRREAPARRVLESGLLVPLLHGRASLILIDHALHVRPWRPIDRDRADAVLIDTYPLVRACTRGNVPKCSVNGRRYVVAGGILCLLVGRQRPWRRWIRER